MKVPIFEYKYFSGHGLYVLLQIEDFSTFLLKMHKEFIQKGHNKLYVFWLFRFQPVVILSHPDTIKMVMRTNAPKTIFGPGYPFLIPWLGMSYEHLFSYTVKPVYTEPLFGLEEMFGLDRCSV